MGEGPEPERLDQVLPGSDQRLVRGDTRVQAARRDVAVVVILPGQEQGDVPVHEDGTPVGLSLIHI